MGFNTIDFNNIKFDDNNFDNDDHEANIHPTACCNIYKQRKACKIDLSKQLMLVAWHPTRWQDWYMTKDGKKRKRTILIDEKYYHMVSIS